MSIDISKRLAVNSIYSMFLESKFPQKITFHHVLQRLNVLLQDRLAYALLKEKNNNYVMYYPFSNDPVGAPRIASFYRKKFGSSTNPKSDADLRKYLFKILDTNYYLMCIRILPIKKKEGRFKFIKLEVSTTDDASRELIKKRLKAYNNSLKKNEKTELFELVDNEPDIITRYVLNKVFHNDEQDKNTKTGFDTIEDNFPRYKDYILGSIKQLENRSLPKSIKNYWYQDSVFKAEKPRLRINKEAFEIKQKKFDEHFLGQKGALNISFKKVQPNISNLYSPETKNELPQITNFLFFVQRAQYKKEKNRLRQYNYGLRLAIPHDQEVELVRYFRKLNTLGKSNFIVKSKSYFDAFYNTENKFSKWIDFCDEEFWGLIKTPKKLINILGSSFGQHIRSIVDPPLYWDNFTHYPYAFENGGIERVLNSFDDELNKISSNNNEKKEILKKHDLYNDCIRTVTLYYLIFGMTPLEERSDFNSSNTEHLKYENLALSVTPISLRGASYACIAHYSSLGDAIRLKNSNWQKSYNFYHSIDIRFRRTLRQQLEALYLKNIKKIVAHNIIGIINGSELKKDYSIENINKVLNNDINQYIGFIPFEHVELQFIFNHHDPGADGVASIYNTTDSPSYINIITTKNQYFINFFDYSSSIEEKVTISIRSAIDSSLKSLQIISEAEKERNSSNTKKI